MHTVCSTLAHLLFSCKLNGSPLGAFKGLESKRITAELSESNRSLDFKTKGSRFKLNVQHLNPSNWLAASGERRVNKEPFRVNKEQLGD